MIGLTVGEPEMRYVEEKLIPSKRLEVKLNKQLDHVAKQKAIQHTNQTIRTEDMKIRNECVRLAIELVAVCFYQLSGAKKLRKIREITKMLREGTF